LGVEDVSEDFSKMNWGQDVITESERIKEAGAELSLMQNIIS
jgi:hypothetical protein